MDYVYALSRIDDARRVDLERKRGPLFAFLEEAARAVFGERSLIFRLR